ncbi:MAG: D-tyrosyl-tRNA(Tyr) deacylase [Candidatus Syntrophoarchaeum sp. GoM_oil]|nr:MAG: D-tyrosyl-tRNA(Tyr) deacylase [Candidatus Syntrophoarchaeum sp. GoM_oil]
MLAVEEGLLYMNTEVDTDLIIFASKHKSESGRPSFTVHAPGNFGVAEFGGRDRTLGMACAVANRAFLKALFRDKSGFEAFEISLEVTHHGPTLITPSVFVELGSSDKEWRDMAAAKFIAETILNGINTLEKEYKGEIAIGFGGGHYAPKFTKHILKEDDSAISHIFPRYQFPNLTTDIILEMIEKTVEDVDIALIDRKGFKKDERNHLIDLLDELGIQWRVLK